MFIVYPNIPISYTRWSSRSLPAQTIPWFNDFQVLLTLPSEMFMLWCSPGGTLVPWASGNLHRHFSRCQGTEGNTLGSAALGSKPGAPDLCRPQGCLEHIHPPGLGDALLPKLPNFQFPGRDTQGSWAEAREEMGKTLIFQAVSAVGFPPRSRGSSSSSPWLWAHFPDQAAVPVGELGLLGKVLQEQGWGGSVRSFEEHRQGETLSFWKKQWQILMQTQIFKLHGGTCAWLITDFSICSQHQWYFLQSVWATGLKYYFPLSFHTHIFKSLVSFMYLRKESHTNVSKACKKT